MMRKLLILAWCLCHLGIDLARANPGAPAAASTLRAPLGASLTGRVMQEDATPASGAQVRGVGVNGETRAVTDATGAYLLSGLMPGPVSITATDATGKWMASAHNIMAKAGAATEVADLVLMQAALIEGTITDEATGQPLAGIAVMRQPTGQDRANGVANTVRTNQVGHFQLSVMPGAVSLLLWPPPEGYSLTSPLPRFDIKPGETKQVVIKLSRGLQIFGTATDAQGQLVPDAQFKALVSSKAAGGGQSTMEATVRTDAKGKWTLNGVRPGQITFSSLGDWEVVAPQQLTLPLNPAVPGGLKITLRRVPLLTLTGRTMTPDRKPIANVRIKALIETPVNAQGSRLNEHEIYSDERGQFTLEKLRRDVKVSLSTRLPGYRYVSGGQVTQQGNSFQAQNLVLVPLTAKITGRVTDVAGKPVADATVISPEGDSNARTTTDAEGQFELTSIPAGEVSVIAGYKGSMGEARDVTGQTPVTLKLSLMPKQPAQDIERAYDLLEELWSTIEPDKPYRKNIPSTIASHAPDMAAKLATKRDGSIDEQILSQVITVVAQADPRRATEWAPAKLKLIEDENTSFYPKATLALALATAQPKLAQELYQQAKANDLMRVAKEAPNQQPAGARAVVLARVARVLGLEDDAAQFVQIAIKAVKSLPQASPERQRLLVSLAGIEYEETARLLDQLPIGERKLLLQQAVTHNAYDNSAIAKQWLGKLMTIEVAALRGGDASGTSHSGLAAQTLIQALAKTDAPGTLELAQYVQDNYNKPIVLALAAQYQPKDVALQVLREAGALVSSEEYNYPDAIARVAALAYELDPELGTSLFAVARQRLDEMYVLRDIGATASSDDSTAAFAYYYSRFDPAFSRLILEAEFARLMHTPGHGDDGYQRSWQLKNIVEAMAASDVDRAVEMALLIPIPDRNSQWSNPQVEARRAIAQYVLLSEADRRIRSFQQWGAPGGEVYSH